MSYFQILCQNGCFDSGYQPVTKLIANIFDLVRIICPIALVIVAIIMFILSCTKKDKKYAKYKKTALILLLIALCVFIIATIITVVLNGMMPQRDEVLNCWCK